MKSYNFPLITIVYDEWRGLNFTYDNSLLPTTRDMINNYQNTYDTQVFVVGIDYCSGVVSVLSVKDNNDLVFFNNGEIDAPQPLIFKDMNKLSGFFAYQATYIDVVLYDKYIKASKDLQTFYNMLLLDSL